MLTFYYSNNPKLSSYLFEYLSTGIYYTMTTRFLFQIGINFSAEY